MENIPALVIALFVATTFATLYFLYRATHKALPVLIITSVWLLAQGVIAHSGFYTYTKGLPPRFALLAMPPMVLIAMLFITPRGRRFIDGCSQKWFAILHMVRIPVEIVLVCLYAYHTIPRVMTIEGHNFDLLSGLTAPFIVYFGYYRFRLSRTLLLVWNAVCLILLVNILVTAILSGPFAFQKFGFEQPNVAILYFPFVWLPCFIVPSVMFGHLVSIRQLVRGEK